MSDNADDLIISISADQATLRRSVQRIEQTLDGLTGSVRQKFAAVGKAIDDSVSTSMQNRINAMVGIGTRAAKDWTGALADQGRELDRLRSKYSPLFATIKQYQTAQADIRTLYRSGKIGVDEYTAALSRERQASLASIAAIKGRGKAQNDNAGGGSGSSYIFRNIAQQVNQIGQQGASSGNYLQALAIQLPDILGAFGSLPLVLAGGAAAVAGSFLTMALETKKLDDILADHEKIINRIVGAYGGLAEEASKAGTDSKQLINALGTKNQTALRLSAASEATSFFQSPAVGRVVTGGRFGERGQGYYAFTPQFQQELMKLRAEFKAGKPDFDAFYESISRKVELDPSLAAAAVNVISQSEKFKEAADAMKQYQRVRDALFNDRGANGQLLSQGTTNTADAGNFALYQAQQAVTLRRSTQSFYARLSRDDARSPRERSAAARAEAASQYLDESPRERSQRINQAAIAEYVRANQEVANADRDRKLALDAAVRSQEEDLGLVGKVGASAEALRREYQLTADLRSEAAKRGITDEREFLKVYADQIALIKQNAAEYGRLAEARARAQISSDISFQRDQLSRSPEQRNIAEQLKGAGLPVDLLSKSAKEISDANDAATRQSKDWAQKAFDAQVAGINARSPTQRVAAARAAAEAQFNPTEPTELRQQRVNNAELVTRAQIAREMADAERERSATLKKLLDDERQDIAMIGKTGGAAAAAAQQYQQLSQLRAEATKQGITDEAEFQKVFGAQIDLIKRTAESYGKLIDTAAKLRLSQDLNDQNRLSVLPPRERQIVQMQRQYGLPEDPNSDTGKAIGRTIDRQSEGESIDQFSSNLANGIISSGGKIGKAFGEAFLSSLQEAARKQLTDIFSQLLRSVLMPNSAATSGAAGVAGLGTQTVGRLLSPTSLNANPASPTSQTGVAAQAWNFFASKGLQPHQIAGVLGNIGAESSFNPKSIGDAGQAFGLFQHHADRGGGSGLIASGATGQLEHAWAELQGPENRAFQALMKSTDVRGATAAFAGFERPRGFSWSNPEGADNFSGRLNAANDALSKFGGTTNQATQVLGALGSGLGQLGSTLGSGVGGAATGGGGILGWIGKIFGGGGQFAAARAGLLKPGLFADGGHVAGPGTGRSDSIPAWLSNGEFVVNSNATKKHRAMLEAINNGSIARFADGGLVTPRIVSAPVAPSLAPRMAAAGNDNRQPGILQVHINGANGDDHVRMLVKQGVGEGLSSYNTQQQRGGFGTLQGQYNSRKG